MSVNVNVCGGVRRFAHAPEDEHAVHAEDDEEATVLSKPVMCPCDGPFRY